MKKIAAVCLISLFFAVAATSAVLETVYDVEQSKGTFPSAISSVITLDDMKTAIINAAAETDPKWELTENGDGAFTATLNNKEYTAVADIKYSNSYFTITYKDSKNLNFSPKDDKLFPYKINTGYNRWVTILEQKIRLNVRKVFLEARKRK
ncbi:MAG: hypothetical protein LBO62_01375 [Endomicrobium sp.]|jgi:hypothetical protein|nr:hypothetical protein [Endomicrobium sp.]